MKTVILSSLMLFLLVGFYTPAAKASTSMRCGTHLVQGGGRHGPTMYEVLKKCGEPNERHTRFWIYTKHGRDFRLHFDGNGILLSVQRIDRF